MVNCKGIAAPTKPFVHQEICRYCRTVHKKLTTGDLRRRRHTSAIAPTSRSVDFSHPRQSRARHLLRANATELQAARRLANATELHTPRKPKRVSKSYSYDFTATTARMAIRDATSTETKGLELSMMDLRDVPKSQSCDLTGSKALMDVSEDNELELSTVDLRLPKYKVNVPVPTKRGRRASSADPVNSALTPISIENLAAIEAKLSSVELELKRYDVMPKSKTTSKKIVELPKSSSSVSSGASSSSMTEPVDFHLSTVDLRPRQRRHTTTDTKSKVSQHGNRVSVVEEGCGGFSPFQRKKSPEPIDFHLSTFDLRPRKLKADDLKPESNQVNIGRHKSRTKKERVKTVPETPEQTTPKYSKNEPCDLAYLDNFRSYTV
ncbi:hypothetical protein PHMEG_0006824 [Phytophthora megakarya]|uniref:Uncharacterized protein n=1 Tax=Phytophthora megakarya TaxID=4795 RepID=A0A225WQ52_9STRA|nr:hypothetical protein PHMEG_0006824 [Phytophthora megakarya]